MAMIFIQRLAQSAKKTRTKEQDLSNNSKNLKKQEQEQVKNRVRM
jgi:hypothetical protein